MRANNNVCFCVLNICLWSVIFDFAIPERYSPPRIYPRSPDEIAHSGSNLTLKCEGKEPVSWTYPNVSTTISERINITLYQSSDPEYIFGSSLSITNVSYLDVGFYYCHGNGTDLEDTLRVSSIYLFVEDENELSLLGDLPVTVSVTQYSKAILPCRPTSPDVSVELVQTTGEDIENVSYDPKVGFSFWTSDLSTQAIYSCKFRKGDKEILSEDIYLFVLSLTDSIAKPFIEDLTGGHTVEGDKLILKCSLKYAAPHFAMDWIIPDMDGLQNNRIIVTNSRKDSHDTFSKELVINRTTKGDEGKYICLVKDYNHENNNSVYIRIYEKSEHFINLTEENGVYDISVQAGEPSVQWRISVQAHPIPELLWYNNKGDMLPTYLDMAKNQKYEVRTDTAEAFLKINDVTIFDRGFYTLNAVNEFGDNVTLQLFLNVTDKPTVQIDIDNFHLINRPSTIKCTVAAYPQPSVYWFYKPCKDYQSCNFEPRQEDDIEQKGLLQITYLTISANDTGYVMCYANNSLGSDNSTSGFYVTDVPNGFNIWISDDNDENMENEYVLALGDKVELNCAASVHNYTDQIFWYRTTDYDFTPVQNDAVHDTEQSHTHFSYKTTLIIKNLQYDDSGNYTCRVNEISQDLARFRYSNITITVKEPQDPEIIDSNLDPDGVSINFPESLEFYCYASGIPKPIIYWYKNDIEINPNENNSRVKIEDKGRKLVFNYTEIDDESTYSCQASNKMGYDKRSTNLKIKNKLRNSVWLIGACLILFLFLLILIPVLAIKIRNEKKLQKELKKAGLDIFEKGAIDSINPELGIDDQAELLPYDKKWEFPREKLKLGKQLGSGAFGVVMKAEAQGINSEENSSIVAVKMVKRDADYTYIRALASELKIMVHLGKHLNVVNLLGACTKNVAKRELFVVVEYCRYGNLHNYLLRHRDSFINQIDPKTGKIDYTIGSDLLERSFSISSNKSSCRNPNGTYRLRSDGSISPTMADYRGDSNYSGRTNQTEMTNVCMTPTGGDDGMVLSNNSIQPEWRSNYRGDYKGGVKPICTKDLVSWSFQVARGMEYLASRKVMHGDLAARNVLLADNNVVKICDFGLAKSMYKSDNYKKRGEGPLPVKWMAIESIRDRVFSTQSDVWSYGIVLWEFFSLARTPYPGMEADERLYHKLVDGYRMDSPDYATKDIYKVMHDCWNPKPLKRPTFSNLVSTMGIMLEESVRQHYVDLNDPYLKMNTQRLENGQSDYLAMLSPQDYYHISSPHHYINDNVYPPTETPGYLCMKPAMVFSPRSDNSEDVFDFDPVRRLKNGDEDATGTELLPILHAPESDSEKSPTGLPSFSNPSYHIPPKVDRNDDDIVRSTDNYVNMPQNKSAIGDKVTYKNLSNINTISNEYVNSNSRDWETVKV